MGDNPEKDNQYRGRLAVPEQKALAVLPQADVVSPYEMPEES